MSENTSSTKSFDLKPMKILCIHGYRQNGDVFRLKTGSLRKLLKQHAELVYITAPNEIVKSEESTEEESGESPAQRGWWFTNENNTFESKKFCDTCVGLERSIAVVDAAFKEQGPFDGLLGFSQGASFVSLLCGMRMKEEFQHKFKFAIMVAGFKSRCSLHNIYYEVKNTIPSLHVFGATDQVIPQEMSEELLQYFEEPQSAIHPGGHYVPALKCQKDDYLNLFKH